MDLQNGFQKFYRGDSARGTKDGNSGLGLAIVKKLVESMGGSVTLENSERGAVVKFTH